ncbi:MAG TPA: CPBP family intramembrane glutamic endopeptidase [Anaerolineales bacterium]|nr:CPBP family intramembrane glutamic endopeptidase [Anaerolineales bacterium]
MNTLHDFLKRYAIVLFFPLTYLLSWSSVLVPQAQAGILPHGPALAALILIALTEGRAGISAWWKRITNWRVNWIWYLVAPAIMIVFQLGGGVIHVWVGTTYQPLELSNIALSALMLVFFGGQWEEPGWTGYALPKLQGRFAGRPLLASTILATLRGIWHLPLVVSGAIPWYDMVFLSFAMQFIISWLYNRTNGSALIAFLFHFTSNITGMVTRQLFTGEDWTRYYILFIAVAFVSTAVLVARAGPHLGMQKEAEQPLVPRPVTG